MKHALYYLANGQITRAHGLPDGDAPDPQPGESCLVTDDRQPIHDHYVNVTTRQVVQRPPCPGDGYRWVYDIKSWQLDTRDLEVLVRQRRDALLVECDWTQLPDVPEATQARYQAYRQALRDVTAQPGFPTAIQWPEQP